jgi:chromosome segregation ATPase
MSSEVLRPACELAFTVARDGAEAVDPIEPPAAMRSFLYVEDLPRRAIAAAQQVIEENSDFRHRVALRADEDEIGRAGYLWLRRPTGWAQEFEALAVEDEPEGDDPSVLAPDADVEAIYNDLTSQPIELVNAQPPEPEEPSDERSRGLGSSPFTSPLATISQIGGSDTEAPRTFDRPTISSGPLGLAAVTNTENADIFPAEAADREPEGGDDHTVDPEADALENELASLRGLVERLASERESVVSSVPDLGVITDDVEVPEAAVAPVQMVDTSVLKTDLDAAHHELYLANADLTIARQEREEAQRLQSEALKRQVQMEKELAKVREQKADLESQLGSDQAKVISTQERLGRIEAQLAEAEREREVVRSQLETMTLERNQIRDERASLRAERDELRARLDEIDEKTGGVDLGELMEGHRTATAELETTSRELARLISQAEGFETQVEALSAETTTLKTERMDLRGRLGETETALDVVTTQYEALKIDAERMAADLGSLRAERDGLQSQLADLQTSLSDVLADQAESRQRNDADRRALNELRVERDVTLSRLGDLEQAEQDGRRRIESLVAERDELLAGRDELLDERGQLRADLNTAASERASSHDHITTLERQVGSVEAELQRERRQREELAARLLELDEQAELHAAEQATLHQERDDLAAAVERLENERVEADQFRRERDNMASELADARSLHNQQVSEFNRLVEEAGAEATRVQADRDEVEERLTETAAQLAVLRAQLAEAEVDRARLEGEQEQVASELEERRTAAEAYETTVSDLRAALAEAESRADQGEVALQVKESELRTVLGARTADGAEIEKLRTNLADAMVRADEQLAEKSAELAERTELLAAREEELDALRAESSSMRSAVESATSELQSSGSELAMIRAELDDVRSELASTRDELAAARSDLESNGSEAVSLRSELQAARDELSSSDSDLVSTREELAAIRDELDSATAELVAVRSELTSTSAQLESASTELEAGGSEAVALRAELDAAREELTTTSSELSLARRDVVDGADDLAAARSELDRVNDRLRQADDEVARLQEQLAVTRVELASTSAELEAQSAVSPPAVPPSVVADFDHEDDLADGDELDSMAAEVRSALRGPSVLDTIAAPPAIPDQDRTADAEQLPDGDAPSAGDVDGGLLERAGWGQGTGDVPAAGGLDHLADRTVFDESVFDHPGSDGTIAEPEPPEPPEPTTSGELDLSIGGRHDDLVRLEDDAGPPRDPFGTVTPPTTLAGDDDDLDAISELIAQKVSTFDADEIDLGREGGDEMDLAAELARRPGGDDLDEDDDQASSPPSILGGPPAQVRPAEQPDLGVRRPGGPKRRRIEIPGDIVDDEVAVARYVVSSPDVVLLVDGDSVAQLGWPKLTVAQQRDALVTYLADLSASSGAAPDVVFDGRIGDDDSLPASRAVRIRLSTPPTPPTAALDELVDAYPEQWPIALVTDDPELSSTANERGAAVLNNGQLLDLFIAE